jgi:hypothetical protein
MISNNLDIPQLERPVFFDGQRLTEADLAAVQTYYREKARLHNRGLHGWGVVFGLTVTGKRGERTVQIQPGYALDCIGREIILSQTTSLAIPAVAAKTTYYLTITYAEDSDLIPETRAGTCGTSGAVRLPEVPLIRWHSASEGYTRGIDLILGTIEIENCQLAADLSSAERRYAQPAQQPYVAAGQSLVAETIWRLWPEPDVSGESNPVGIATTVYTTAAGFRATPRYQAHVIGQRDFEWALDEVSRMGVIDGYLQISQPAAASFDLIMFLPIGSMGVNADFPVILNPPPVLTPEFLLRLQDPNDLGWSVVWLGVEG